MFSRKADGGHRPFGRAIADTRGGATCVVNMVAAGGIEPNRPLVTEEETLPCHRLVALDDDDRRHP
jgi:hypothetical protein